MKRMRTTWAVAILVGCSALGCNSRGEQAATTAPGDFTRSEAKERIQADQRFASGTRRMSLDWDVAVNGVSSIAKFRDDVPPDVGMALSSAATPHVASARQRGRSVELILTHTLEPLVMEVVGITDEGTSAMKLVPFQWRYKDLPEVLAPFIGTPPPYQGQALFRK